MRGGEWALAAMPPASYKVMVSKPGFRSQTIGKCDGQRRCSGQNRRSPGTRFHYRDGDGASGARRSYRPKSATLSNTVQARQVAELPFATRNAVELMVTQPGVATPGNPRSSSINGLPKGAINVTVDGMNTQDSLLKSNDGFFSYIYTPVDAGGRNHPDHCRGAMPWEAEKARPISSS